MADTTTPVTPPAQDLQINLAEAPKAVETVTPENKPAELDLNLDLNLPEAPKNDDRLKAEDQKNAEVATTPVAEEVLQPTPEVKEEIIPAPVMEPIPELVTEAPVVEAKTEEVVAQVTEPSKVIEDEVIPATAPAELKEDMNIINDLESHASAGGLSPEATVDAQPAPVETPKTFDLDSMLGPVNTPVPVEPVQAVMNMPPATTTAPVEIPAFTIPTTTTQVPVQAVPQITLPKKASGVKALLFVVLFVALGFTTFFILKTMYPVEFDNIFGGGQTNMHASEVVTGTELTDTELTGTELTGTELTGTETTEETIDTGTTTDNAFGELNDLGTDTTAPAETDLSRLTDYVTQGNYFLEQGKTMGNNTIIKYGLYISKKATDFLGKIANGEEINNLSGYFAQFDQYIAKLQELVGQTANPDTTVTTSEESVSASPIETNDLQPVNDTSAPTPETTIQ